MITMTSRSVDIPFLFYVSLESSKTHLERSWAARYIANNAEYAQCEKGWRKSKES